MNTINAEEILIPLIKCRCRSFSRIFPAQTQSPIQTRSHLATVRVGGASKDVENRVTNALSKWRELSGVFCDKKSPTKVKLLIYQTVIRPTLLYGCETWQISVKGEKRMATTEMRMVRWEM